MRVLIVDDYEPWRRFFSSTIQQQGLQILGEASDGQEAVQKAHELRPDLILLDIGLPTLNGLEVARQIRKLSPASKILFVSENRSVDIIKEALSTAADGYVLKSDAAGELFAAIRALVEGKRFVSTSLAADGFTDLPNLQTGTRPHRDGHVTLSSTKSVESTRNHEVGFYSDEKNFLDDVTRFISAALKAGNAAIVVATESHRDSILSKLVAHGCDMGIAIEQGMNIQLNAAETLSTFMVNGIPDPIRFLELFGDLIVRAGEASKDANPRVSVFGEGVHLLWEQGNTTAAIQIEKLCNKLTQIHQVNILCGYSVGRVESGMDSDVFQRICAEHSAAHSH